MLESDVLSFDAPEAVQSLHEHRPPSSPLLRQGKEELDPATLRALCSAFHDVLRFHLFADVANQKREHALITRRDTGAGHFDCHFQL
jgi:hypothetical protein